jgi:ABC-type amino acid transport substrate-binding protein
LPEDQWNIAVAMRKHDVELKKRVDSALEKLVKDGTVSRAMARYHVPYFAPFADKKKEDRKDDKKDGTEAAGDVIRHPVADRGPEPQMQKVQTSRNAYGGLERVRSAGILVVGLDPKNLPFSAAHPEPAGFDYEIARLLAEKLGVKLHVYWAYSAHDSYPSKLATKKLCDVMLGVMPDDRFGQRVLYSRPYYMARFQLVVPAGAALTRLDELGDEPLAAELGIAARGLEGRKSKTYSSLEDVLDAVATKQVKAGYVISTRGHYLADQRLPDKLRFLDGDAADRFPICAAVRKSDSDLKEAIDQAWQELAESGKLEEVFTRWHVPYAAPPKSEKKKER